MNRKNPIDGLFVRFGDALRPPKKCFECNGEGIRGMEAEICDECGGTGIDITERLSLKSAKTSKEDGDE